MISGCYKLNQLANKRLTVINKFVHKFSEVEMPKYNHNISKIIIKGFKLILTLISILYAADAISLFSAQNY